VEGANLVLEWWYSEDEAERRRVLAEDFVRRKLDVIVVQSTTETVAMKQATTTIPVVMVLIGDPVGAGLVQSLSRPGGNITGTSLMSSETFGKGIEFLKELVPQARRLTVLGNPDNASVVRMWAETRAAATQLGIELLSAEARSRDELATAFAAIVRERPDALVVLLDSLTVDHRHQIVEFAATHRRPALYGGPMFAEVGGYSSTPWIFMSFGGAPRSTWIAFSRAPSPPTFRSSNPRNSSSSSTERRQMCSASRSRHQSSPAPTR
jgi:ABC-type uncharacterized transport system substrate-binding protein